MTRTPQEEASRGRPDGIRSLAKIQNTLLASSPATDSSRFRFELTKVLDEITGFLRAIREDMFSDELHELLVESPQRYMNPGGRLSVSSTNPAPDGTNTGSTLYYVPAVHDQIALWDGEWILRRFTDHVPSLTVSPGALTRYDVFAHWDGGQGVERVTLDAEAWTSLTSRAKALQFVEGIPCHGDNARRRYLGNVIVDASNNFHDTSAGNRWVVNNYNKCRWVDLCEESLIDSSGVVTTWETDCCSPVWGDESDGAVTISSNTQITEELNCTSLSVTSGDYYPEGYEPLIVRCTGDVTISSGASIQADGKGQVGGTGGEYGVSTAGADASATVLCEGGLVATAGGGGGSGVAGGDDGGDGGDRGVWCQSGGGAGGLGTSPAAGADATTANSSARAYVLNAPMIGLNPLLVGGGGAGGGGAASTPPGPSGTPGAAGTAGSHSNLHGNGGNGGNATGSAMTGGGGGSGAGGGVVVLFVKGNVTITGTITALGGNGGNGGTGSGTGQDGSGGGGGGGGVVAIFYGGTLSGIENIDISGGTGGTGLYDGGDGETGFVLVKKVLP